MKSKYEFNSKIYQLVGKNINKYRLKSGLSLAELSKYTSISESTLKNIENACPNSTISIYNLYKISTILQVSMEKFFI